MKMLLKLAMAAAAACALAVSVDAPAFAEGPRGAAAKARPNISRSGVAARGDLRGRAGERDRDFDRIRDARDDRAEWREDRDDRGDDRTDRRDDRHDDRAERREDRWEHDRYWRRHGAVVVTLPHGHVAVVKN